MYGTGESVWAMLVASFDVWSSSVMTAHCVAWDAYSSASSPGAIAAFGVTEDAGKYSRDGGGPFFAQLADLGMNENAITIYWDPSLPGGMAEPGLLDRTLPYAAADGIRVVLTVYAARARQFTDSPTAAAQFASFLERLARSYPQVEDFVIGNEP